MAVPSCAGAYMSGAAGSNECPAGSARIETADACRTAAAAAAKGVGSAFVETDAAYPRGCYYGNANAYFNKHAVGAGHSNAQLLCAALVTGAPPHADGTPGGTLACSKGTYYRGTPHEGFQGVHGGCSQSAHGVLYGVLYANSAEYYAILPSGAPEALRGY